ncbi:hypothetical protein KDH_79700 [Dictyobacter sp. S3.2.2.5]|uniref:PRA1 family protein n=1 Tax=Dictyobacter halimunensis TaxID=3026934 RepID=A0ABQ6G3P2_9CHLR|nr:hypothetical protein KDH_79700 [Dictyobacter sp. S3.2.2.5]
MSDKGQLNAPVRPDFSSPRRSFFYVVRRLPFPLLRQLRGKTTPEDDEAFIQILKDLGASDETIPKIQAIIQDGRTVGHNRKESYRSDVIYVGGIAVLDLVLLQVLTSVGRPQDIFLYVSWLAFAFSLPCAAGFLYITRLQNNDDSYGYSPVHEKLAFVSIIAGGLSAVMVAAHFWLIAGIVLFVVSVLVLCVCLLFHLLISKEFTKVLSHIYNLLQQDRGRATPDNGV